MSFADTIKSILQPALSEKMPRSSQAPTAPAVGALHFKFPRAVYYFQ